MELFFPYPLFYTSFLIFLASEKCHVLFLKLKLGSWVRYSSCAKESKHQFHCPFMSGSCFDFVTWQTRIGLIGKDFCIIWDQNRASLVAQIVKTLPTIQFNPWVQKIPQRRKWQPTPVFLPEEFHGQRSLVGYTVHGVAKSQTWLKWLSTWGHKTCFDFMLLN